MGNDVRTQLALARDKRREYRMMMMMISQAGNGGGEEVEEVAAVATRRCEDCGNQAKKECKYKRCRRCCNRKGFHCKTHVTSTWVPAACRRTTSYPLSIHQQTTTTTIIPPLPQHHAPGLSSSSIFPAEVSATAVFRCCRVSSAELDEQYAYQTAVNIGGHVFKGILYDQAGRHENQRMMMQPQQRRQRPITSNHAAAAAAGGGLATLASAAGVRPPSSAYPNFSLSTTSTSGTQRFFFGS